MPESIELLFFDTFAHDNTEELNLDLVQFPKPVYVTEVRIIPLGARVQADFPGGVRLGATNPSQFQIEFFVNDLGKPGASTFESLGGFEYNQNGCINLNCIPEDTVRKIPTDGLVLRGWYTTITLAVYGTLTNNITEQIVQPIVNPSLPAQPNTIADAQQIISANHPIENEWNQENITEYNQNASYQQSYNQAENYTQEYNEYYSDVPKDPRSYHLNENEWDKSKDRERQYQKTGSNSERSDKDKSYRPRSRDRDRPSRDYREVSREREWDRDWDRNRERSYKHDDYRRYDREDRKRPRTPPIQSPKRPHTPHKESTSPLATDSLSDEEKDKEMKEEHKSPLKEPTPPPPPPEETPTQMDVEEFEPILSDEEIVDEELDYDLTAYTNNDDLIKLFIPGVTNLRKFEQKSLFQIENAKILIDENFKTTIGIVDDYFNSSITKYVLDDFPKLNQEIKEEFIHLSEKLITIFNSIEHFCEIIRLYSMIQNVNFSSNEDKELIGQVNTITITLVDWLKIATNYEMANMQNLPVYKIRHIKCGVRLVEFCCNSLDLVKLLWDWNYNIHQILFNLYDQEYMALSIKLMIIKALDTYLLHKFAIEKFLIGNNDSLNYKENGYHDSLCSSNNNGYKILVEKLRKNPSVRLKFAINSILKKLNLYEIFHKLHSLISDLRTKSDVNLDLIIKALDQILNATQDGQFAFSQPKRFLPVSSQYEIARTPKNILVIYYRMFDLIQSIFVLLTNPKTFNQPIIKTFVFDILSDLVKSQEGLDYLADNYETVQYLLKCLLRSDEDDFVDAKSHNLGLEITYKIEILYYINSLKSLGLKFDYDYENLEIIDQLHGLFCLTFTHMGRICVSQVLGMKDNITSLLQFLDDFNIKEKSENLMMKLKKSPAIAYIFDLIFFTITSTSNVQFLETYFKQINQLVDADYFEDSTQQRLSEIKSFLSPLENVVIHYDNISHFVEIINKNIDNVTSFPGQLITSLRIMHHFGISPYSNCENYIELKYKHSVLQLFSLDGMSLILKILQKICDYYQQPNLHTFVFASIHGFTILNVIQPCLELLKQMLTYVIECRNTNFKDLTAVNVLLQTYNLLNSYPTTNYQAQDCCKIIIDTLLVYTQPVSEDVTEKDSLSKTLWTLMVGEVIKFITTAPYTFIPGLLVLSELLPLPLPIETNNNDLTKDEIVWAVNLRKLWSAHLHLHSNSIQELINKLCTTSNPQLLNLLRRVCVQIADLASNSALMIARGVLDSVLSIDDKLNGHTSRLLNFLACLVTHATLKCAILYLIRNSNTKSDEKYSLLLQIFTKILKIQNESSTNIQAQECILSIIQSLCDVELTVMQNTESDLYLSNALPIKEHVLNFLSMILDFLQMDSCFVTYLPAIRTLLLLTEHDYGFYHLREQINKRSNVFGIILKKLKNLTKDNECLSTLNTLIEFLRVCATTEDVEATFYTPRRMKMSIGEIKNMIGWKKNDDEQHPLQIIEEILKKLKTEDLTFERLWESVNSLVISLESEDTYKETYQEPLLPEPESLLVQFSGRLIYNCSEICDDRLTIRYWLSNSNDESETENVSCDLSEIVRQFLPQEFNIAREIEKLCRICPNENSNEKDSHENDQKVKMKKPFVTPIRSRGFPRTIQQRTDLFRSRPPNTSRPPSLHVDDFVALETCGAQPTGPTGYNKFSRELLASTRLARGSRGRVFVASERSWWGVNLVRGSY